MRIVLTILILGAILKNQVLCQNIPSELNYPDTLWSSNDTFYVNSPKMPEIWTQAITKDTLNLGTYGNKGVYMTIWTDLDTIEIPDVNYPYRQLVKIHVASKKDTTLCILRFQPAITTYTNEYAASSRGRYRIEIPETYELANIILYLSNCSIKTRNHPTENDYVSRVQEHFKPFENHPIVKILNKECSLKNYLNTYYDFRDNSICFQFVDKYLEYNTQYKQVYWDGNEFGGEFRNLLYLVQDFANKSNFRKFYQENLSYYKELIERQEELLPVRKMWNWLENEFPAKMDSYVILFSPLIGGSHRTQKFHKGFWEDTEFHEAVMFINSTIDMDNHKEYSEKIKAGKRSGVVFTEIDHNYVNPISNKNKDEIKKLFSNKENWASKESSPIYSNEIAIFNEYMTHALFCLYVQENYSEDDAKIIIDGREKLMKRRGFIRFNEFNEILLTKFSKSRRESKTIAELYPQILEEVKKIN